MTVLERLLRDKADELGISYAYEDNKELINKEFASGVVKGVLSGSVSGRQDLELLAENIFDKHIEKVHI